MALEKKFVDLQGLSYFRDSLLEKSIADSNKNVTNKTANVKAIADYVDKEVNTLSNAVTSELSEKVEMKVSDTEPSDENVSLWVDTSATSDEYYKKGEISTLTSTTLESTDTFLVERSGTPYSIPASSVMPQPANLKQVIVNKLPNVEDAEVDTIYTLNGTSGDMYALSFRVGIFATQYSDASHTRRQWITYGGLNLNALDAVIKAVGVGCLNYVKPVVAALLAGENIYSDRYVLTSVGEPILGFETSSEVAFKIVPKEYGEYCDIYFLDTDAEGKLITKIVSINSDGTLRS